MEVNANIVAVEGKNPSLLGIITSPTIQFERLKTINVVWIPMLIMLLLGVISAAATGYAVQNSPEMLQTMTKLGSDVPPLAVTLGLTIVSGTIGFALVYFITAAIYKLCMVFMSNDTPYKKLLAITVYASVISMLGSLVNGVLAIAFGGDGVAQYTSLALLFEKGTVLYAIANAFNVFSIWGMVITGLGLHITAGLSKKQATVLISIFFILQLGLAVAGVMISSTLK